MTDELDGAPDPQIPSYFEVSDVHTKSRFLVASKYVVAQDWRSSSDIGNGSLHEVYYITKTRVVADETLVEN